MASDDLAAMRAVNEALADEARYPAVVVDAILDGDPPLAAWRRYRKLSQAELAEKAGLSQSAAASWERRTGPVGRNATREALAGALDIPESALEPIDD